MRIVIAFLFLILPAPYIQAQKYVYGNVLDSEYRTLPYITIKLYQTDSNEKKLLNFAISDRNGRYNIVLPKTGRLFNLEASSVGYTPQVFDFIKKDDTSAVYKNFILVRSINYLDTVKIDYSFKVQIRGDTIRFNPEAFTQKNENNIEQLLSKLPGFEIDKNGKIWFNGAPVSSVLINGDDLFKDNYQELTQNASPKIIEAIDIIRNYQKDKILKNKRITEGQVLNILLKKKYRHYTLAQLNTQVDIKKSSLAEAFVLHLQDNLKVQARYNNNSIGIPSSSNITHGEILFPTSSVKKKFYSLQAFTISIGIR